MALLAGVVLAVLALTAGLAGADEKSVHDATLDAGESVEIDLTEHAPQTFTGVLLRLTASAAVLPDLRVADAAPSCEPGAGAGVGVVAVTLADDAVVTIANAAGEATPLRVDIVEWVREDKPALPDDATACPPPVPDEPDVTPKPDPIPETSEPRPRPRDAVGEPESSEPRNQLEAPAPAETSARSGDSGTSARSSNTRSDTSGSSGRSPQRAQDGGAEQLAGAIEATSADVGEAPQRSGRADEPSLQSESVDFDVDPGDIEFGGLPADEPLVADAADPAEHAEADSAELAVASDGSPWSGAAGSGADLVLLLAVTAVLAEPLRRRVRDRGRRTA